MDNSLQIRKALVVLGPEMPEREEPLKSRILERAVQLARITGCTLELFHVSYDDALENSLFPVKSELERARKEFVDRDATRLAEIAMRMGEQAVSVEHEVRWDWPRTDAILRKIAQSRPDIVLKRAGEHGYLMGIATHTDWELARRSPAHVWLVHDEVASIDRIVAAIGNQASRSGDLATESDVGLVRTTSEIAEAFKADVHPVNAYGLPLSGTYVGPMAGGMASPQLAAMDQKTLEKLRKQHGEAIRSLAERFDIPQDNVRVEEGHPDKIVPSVADEVDADMIVMGADNMSRLERFFASVTVEPVMARAKCDIFIVREADGSRLPDTDERPLAGEPQCDIGHAITHPEDTFDSPDEVVKLPGVSLALRNRILQAWEYDIRAEMNEENEGGAVVRDIDVTALDDILAARAIIETEINRSNASRAH